MRLKPQRRLIVDMSSLCWTALRKGVDEEFGEVIVTVNENTGRETRHQVNSAQYGFDIASNFLLSAWDQTRTQPKDTILVIESGNTKALRVRVLPEYKSSRGSSPEQMYNEFNQLKMMIEDLIVSLGGSSITRPHLEGDDVIAYLVSELEGERVVMSEDGDMAALLDQDGVELYRKGELTKENPYGPFCPSLLPVYKALVGDPSDKIPGAPRFGEKTWLQFLFVFQEPGVKMLETLIKEGRLQELESNISDFKPLKQIVENQDKVLASYAAARMYPELVENIKVRAVWKAGYVKDRSEIADSRFHKYAGVTRLVHAGNFDAQFEFLKRQINNSNEIALDLETYTPQESDDWLLENRKTKAVDVRGSKVVSMGLTFGSNNQYNQYFTLDHVETNEIKNITRDQFVSVLKLIATDIPKIIHNVAFELPVLLSNFGELTDDVFINPCFDTQIAANYVNENIGRGLKFLSKHYFNYDQVEYDEVTTKVNVEGERHQVKMNQLTAEETLGYGSDDTIMTAALWNHFRIIMELESTLSPFIEIEEKSAYVTALAFHNGTPISLERLREMEKADDELEARSWEILNKTLIDLGWTGTQTPVYTLEDLSTPAKIKEIFEIWTGEKLNTMMRIPEKLYTFIEAQGSEDLVERTSILAHLLRNQDVDKINEGVRSYYDNSPQLDIASTKQLRELMYDRMELPVRWINPATEKERAEKPELSRACYKFGRIQRGSDEFDWTKEDEKLVRNKSKADETSIKFALEFDIVKGSQQEKALRALLDLKELGTRRSLFYNNYRTTAHWETGLMHSSARQCSTVTNRHSYSFQNIQQVPKPDKGDIRDLYVSRYENGVIISGDIGGAELRLGADLSRDPNQLACYVGENLKDMHSLTAAGIIANRWDAALLEKLKEHYETTDNYELFMKIRHDKNADVPEDAGVMRNMGKTVNFATAYDGGSTVVSAEAIIPVSDAEVLIEAKKATYPRFEQWKEEIGELLARQGYVTTYRGVRRHLQDAMANGDKWEISRAKRQGPNAIIQGSCGEVLRLAMVELWESGILKTLRCNFIAAVHDELVIDSHPDDALEVARIVFESLKQDGYMDVVSFVSNISIGTSFYDQPEIEFDDPNIFDEVKVKEAIASAVAKYN